MGRRPRFVVSYSFRRRSFIPRRTGLEFSSSVGRGGLTHTRTASLPSVSLGTAGRELDLVLNK